MNAENVQLVVPGVEHVEVLAAALRGGWSMSTSVDNSATMLEMLERKPEEFMKQARCAERGPPVLPVPMWFSMWWIWDGEFAGLVSFNRQPGSEEIPDNYLGHVGFNVLPEKRGRGYATEALGLLKPLIRAEGMAAVRAVCRPDNLASRRVLEKNGARLLAEQVFEGFAPDPRRLYEMAV